MYFSRLQPSSPHAILDRIMKSQKGNEPYSLHRELYAFFPETPPKERPFLFRQMVDERGRPKIFLLSERKPEERPHWQLETKPYQPQLRTGDYLHFSLRANPVVCQYGKRHDVVMAKIHPLKKAGTPFNRSDLIRQAGLEWLHAKSSACGFAFKDERVRVDGYRQAKLFRNAKTHSKAKLQESAIQFSQMDFEGLLQVTHPDAFQEALCKGIGRARGFGCGLLLIRRP